jgi:hypothetical protein
VLDERGEQEIFRLGDEEVHLHQIDLRSLRQHTHAPARSHEIADLRLRHTHNAVERRNDRAVTEIDLGGLHGGLGGTNIGQGGLRVLIGCLVFLLTDDLRLVKLGLFLESQLLELSLGDRAGVLGFGLRESRLERAGINREKRGAFFNHRALFVVLSQEVTCDLRLDIRVLKTIEEPDPSLRSHNIHF